MKGRRSSDSFVVDVEVSVGHAKASAEFLVANKTSETSEQKLQRHGNGKD